METNLASMLALAWWGWVLIALAVLVAFVWWALLGYRSNVRREFIDFLRQAFPEYEVIERRAAYLRLRRRDDDGTGDGEGQLFLHKLYAAMAVVKSPTPEVKREIFQSFADSTLRAGDELHGPLTLDRHGPRIMPMLVTPAFLPALEGRAPHPHRSIDSLGLLVVYVLDSQQSVAYLNAEQVEELGLDQDGLHELATTNLRRRFSAQIVRDVIEKRTLAMVKGLDGYDATQLLLVPEHLQQGESVAAVIPDRDTLGLAPVDADGGASSLEKVARVPQNPDKLLVRRPIVVTRDGFRLQ